MVITIEEWHAGRCSLYQVVQDGVRLSDAFVEQLLAHDERHAEHLASFLDNLVKGDRIRPAMLRVERPDLDPGVYAIYKSQGKNYNPARLLCAYAHNSDRILITGAGFIKESDEPIQKNPQANREAQKLADIVKVINDRIDTGDIILNGARLIPRSSDSFQL